MTTNTTKLLQATKHASRDGRLAAIALCIVAPITVQRNLWIVLPLVLILAVIVFSLIFDSRKR